MFDDVTRREGGNRAARRGRYLLGSSALQAAGVLVALALSARAPRPEPAPVAVQLVRPAAGPPLRAPALAPWSPALAAPVRPAPIVKTAPGRPPLPAPPRPLGRVETVPAALPEPGPEPGPGEAEGAPAGLAGGGAAPGPSGGAPGGSGPAAASADAVEEAPYPGRGFRRPEQVERNCFQRAIRLPRDLAGFAAGRVTVELVIDREGKPGRFQLVGPVADPRIAAAIWQAVQGCRWLPGADPEGRPTALRVVYPIVFRSG